MARPITWTDVAGPAQTPGILIAANQAARTITDSLSGIGSSFADIGAEQKAAATGAAVASIANAEDPRAAAAALPQDNRFIDPLAVAGATNARKAQLTAEELGAAQLEQARVSTDLSKMTLQDRTDEQLVASKFLPLKDAAYAGKKLDINMEDPWLKTKAGGLFLDRIDNERRAGQSYRFESERAAQGRIAAQAAQAQLKLTLGMKQADDWMAAWRLTPDGSRATKADLQRQGRIFAEQAGVGASYGAQLQTKYGSDEFRGLATEGELLQSAPEGPAYKQFTDAITGKINQLEENQIVGDEWTRIQNAGVLALEQNNYKGLSQGALDAAVIKNNPELKDGFLDWEPEDVTTRRKYQSTLAKQEGPRLAKEAGVTVPENFKTWLTPEQEANLVELTKGEWSIFSDKEDSAAAREMRRAYIAMNLGGGPEAVKARQAAEKASKDAEVAKLRQLTRDVEAAALTRSRVPQEAVTYWGQTPAGQAKAELEARLRQLSQ